MVERVVDGEVQYPRQCVLCWESIGFSDADFCDRCESFAAKEMKVGDIVWLHAYGSWRRARIARERRGGLTFECVFETRAGRRHAKVRHRNAFVRGDVAAADLPWGAERAQLTEPPAA